MKLGEPANLLLLALATVAVSIAAIYTAPENVSAVISMIGLPVSIGLFIAAKVIQLRRKARSVVKPTRDADGADD